MALIIFIILSALCVGAVAAMIVSRNQAHNALFLVLAFAAWAGSSASSTPPLPRPSRCWSMPGPSWSSFFSPS